MTIPLDKQTLIKQLQLQPHLEGGYFRRTYGSGYSTTLPELGERLLMSSIYYLLTDDSPVGYFHRNRSDIVHYWHRGHSLTYYLVGPDGRLSTATLGPDLAAGEQLQLVVAGGTWKATRLSGGEFGLLSEAVAPGFEYADMELASTAVLEADFPELRQQQRELLASLCKS